MRLLCICVLHYAAFILAGQLETLATGITPEVLGECVAHSHCAATEFCSVSVCACHDVDAISNGYHFQQGRTDADGLVQATDDFFGDGRDWLKSPGMYGKW